MEKLKMILNLEVLVIDNTIVEIKSIQNYKTESTADYFYETLLPECKRLGLDTESLLVQLISSDIIQKLEFI